MKIADFGTAKLLRTIAPSRAKRGSAARNWLKPFSGGNSAAAGADAAPDAQMAELTSHTGTLLWEAPEVLRGDTNYTPAADVYSFGIVLWELATRTLPYDSLHATWAVRDAVLAGERPALVGAFAAHLAAFPPGYPALMAACWDADAARRPSFVYVSEQLSGLIAQAGAAAP